LTACAPSLRSRASWVSRRSHFAKPSPRKLKNNTCTKSRPAARASLRSLDCLRAARAQRRLEFVDKTRSGSVPKEYIPAVEKGLRVQKGRRRAGPLPDRGFPSDAGRWQLSRCRFQRPHLSKLPPRLPFARACAKAAPILLEPVMKVETVTPGDHLGDVIATSIAVAAPSRTNWSAARISRWSHPCRFRKCLAISDSYAA